jgi:hypothetical protein
MTDRDERIINIANQIGELLAKHRNQDEALTGLGCYIGVVCHRGDADLPYWIARLHAWAQDAIEMCRTGEICEVSHLH